MSEVTDHVRSLGPDQGATRDDPRDKGMTLVELIVAMGILTLVLAIFMAGVVAMVRTTVRADSSSSAGDQMRTVFQRMDREIRYATDINRPAIVGTRQYVEYRYMEPDNEGVAQCVQWRYDSTSKELQRRNWIDGSPASVSAWQSFVTKGRNDLSVPAQRPFTFYRAGVDDSSGVSYTNQRLRVVLDAGLGSFGDGSGSQLNTILVARNSSDQSTSNTDSNNDGITDFPVCLTGVGRP
ncbi:hypothetical protein GCM10010401_22600 [Rarobacter faecitabidus]|uniref:Prepilin-type N-terminal cleavage/methylation domain-containing protein n=1 Tax=Rarobacter faecitabidus TaxID=13243 RepID=A0A542ZVX8_RARFA|nr:prepilin-type N-terminal cleavage/methylation domain-containing protein [Rarobacter faecitabidus]TQL64462.1 prepilin-type N-terminal cleavage/methylation domain-containing protein [Rarobacter faecitabidus]